MVPYSTGSCDGKFLLHSLLDKATGKQWSRIGLRRRAGILTALSSIKSDKSLGVGEIMDLKLLIHWCVITGNSIIQLLPLNEMRYFRNCPYSVINVFAIDPVYISLHEIASFASSDKVNQYLKQNKAHIEDLRSRKRVDFTAVRKVKLELLKILFLEPYDKESFFAFQEANRHWLDDY